jgi:hypothetical protein
VDVEIVDGRLAIHSAAARRNRAHS